MPRGYGLALLALLFTGCSRQPDLMPLEVGNSAVYVTTYNLQKYVESIKVTREVPIMGRTGYELTGAMGTSRLVWKDGVLYASQTANARFDPPVPLVAVDGKKRSWNGQLEALESVTDASAELTQKSDKIDIGSRRVDTTLSTLTLTLPRGTIQVLTWFQPGVGIVQQEQYTGRIRVLQMLLLPGG